MYPRNAASPEPISIGAVVQISDGAVQTSGVTVRIKPVGVAEGDGAGTTSYSTDGVVIYTPTQAETNYTSFVVIAKKTGCIPVAVTVVTTAESTAGKVSLGGTQTANITGNITGNMSGSVGSVTGNVGGNVTGSVGSLATQAKADVNAEVDQAIADAGIETDLADVLARLPAALVGGRMDSYAGALAGNVLTSSAIDATAVTELQAGLSTLDAAGIRTAIGMASDNLDTQLDALPTAADIRAELDSNSTKLISIEGDTQDIQSRLPAALTANGLMPADTLRVGGTLQTAGDLAGLLATLQGDVTDIATDVLAVLLDTGATLPAQIGGLLTTALAEGYRADGATGSVAELLYELVALNGEFGITGTTKQHKKIDGTTNAFASTLDDATNPTSITRSVTA